MIVGLHLSREKSILKTISKVHGLGANALQFFSSNPRAIRPADIHKFDNERGAIIDFCNDHGFRLVIHSAYTINAATDPSRFERLDDTYWYQTIVADLDIAESLNAVGAVIHVGKYTKLTKQDGLLNMQEFIRYTLKYLKKNKYNTRLLIETAAGQGTELCVDIDEFIDLFNSIKDSKNLGICFDTCHVWVAGYDIIEAFIKIQAGTNNAIQVIHLNGSKVPFGSRKDRHSPILEDSTIPADVLNRFLQEVKRYPQITIILETPGEDPHKEIKFVKK